MASFNKVILMGNIVADPELKQTQSGISVAKFAMGISRKYKNADGSTDTDFIDIVAWRQTAEFICKFFKRGNPILICGQIQKRSYTDKNGDKKYIVEVVADEASFVGAKSDTVKASEANFETLGEDEDLPF